MNLKHKAIDIKTDIQWWWWGLQGTLYYYYELFSKRNNV